VKFTRKIMLAGTGVALMVGSVVLVGTTLASASANAKKTGTGTVTCTTVSGKLSFNPPLATNGPTTGSSTTTFKGKLSSCSGGVPTPTGATVSETSTSNNGWNCATFGANTAKTGTTFAIKWKGPINATSVTFPAGDISVSGGGTGFKLGGGAGTVTGSGSYPGGDNFAGSSSSATTNVNLLTGLCAGGKAQKSITITGGVSVSG